MPKQARSEATYHALLDAAEQVFAAQGYAAASVAAICRAAGVSKGAFYHHFPSKQAVFLALLQRWLQRLEEQLRHQRRAHPDIAAALLAMSTQVQQVRREGRRHWALWLDFWRYAARDPAVWAATAAPYRRFEQMFAEWLAEAQRQGALPDEEPHTAARVLLALAMGVLVQGMLLPDDADWGQVAYRGVLTLLRGWGFTPPTTA